MDSALTNANNIGHIYYFIIIPIAAILYIAYMIFRLKGDRQRKKEWLEKNPNASKIYIGTKNAMLKTVIGAGGITVISIDGEKPIFFTEGLRTGFYAAPGMHTVESSFSKTRSGFFYRSVTTTYRPSKQEISVDASRTYNYLFDTTNETYRFEETTE